MSRRHKRTMAVFFDRYGTGPWTCQQCSQLITKRGRDSDSLNVHHVDHNSTNDSADNLVPLHAKCHISAEHEISEKVKRQISSKLLGRVSPTKSMKFSDEVNAKKSRPGSANPFYGRQHTSDALKRMRQPRTRLTCSDCGDDYAINWINRHKKEGRCVN